MPILKISVFATFVAVILSIDPKSVNIALETFIRIDPQENPTKVLSNINKFLNKIKQSLIPVDIRRIGGTKKKYFTNFLKDVAQAILHLKYEETGWFFKRLYEEIKYYFSYKGSAFANIVKNTIVAKYLVETLKEWSETDPFELKRNMRNYMKYNVNTDNTLNKLGDFLNNFYEQKDGVKMKKYVDKLKNCTEEKDFTKVIRSALHNLVIKHYDKMNYTIRTKISNKLAEYAIQRRFKGDKEQSTTKVVTNINNTASFGNISNIVNDTHEKVKTVEHKDPSENIVPFVEKDLDKIKQKYSKILDKHGQANTTFVTDKNVLRHDISSNTTKKRLKKLKTQSTTQQTVIITNTVLKRFQLLPRLNDNINGTTNTSVPQHIHNNSTQVPDTINNGTTTNSVLQDATNNSKSTTVVPQNVTTKVSDINNGTQTSISVSQNKPNTAPILRVKTESTKHETVPQNIRKVSLITIPVPVITPIVSKVPLRIFGKKRALRTRQKIRGKKRQKAPNISRTVHWLFKRTTKFLSPREIFELEQNVRIPKRKNSKIMTIEERINAMDIDGK